MEVLRCVQCKGELKLSDDNLIGKCKSCGSIFHFRNEKNERIVSLLNHANISRLRGDFDGAILAYQIALKEDETDADAYWGLTLSTFGIDYVEDPRTGKYIPTCRRTIKHSILNDENYLKALLHASEQQAEEFQRQAIEIDNLQNAIKEKVKNEKDFDVFICFKSTDSDGNPTEDRIIARNIYNELEKRNINTFFSEVTLKDRLGEDYEPIIYKAIYTCKIFILVITDISNLQTPWLKNEWARFRDRTIDEGLQNVAFAVFKNIKPSDLPAIFRNQGINLQKYPAGGYEIEIADNLEVRLKQKRFLSFEDPEATGVSIEDKVVDYVDKKLKGSRETVEEKIDRALAYFEINNKTRALEIIDEAIDEYPRKAMGWFTKAKILTDNWEINPITLHLDDQLKEKVFYNISTARRFANHSEESIIKNEISLFEEKMKLLTKTDELAMQFEQKIEDFSKYKHEIESFQNEINEFKLRSKAGLSEAIEINNAALKEVRTHLNNKDYYIKNISGTSWLFSFLNLVAFIVVTIAFFGTIINLRLNANPARTLGEGIILGFIGLLPSILSYYLKRNKKLSKVRDIVDNDKKKLQTLKDENIKLKAEVTQFDEEVTKVQQQLIERRAEKLTKLNEIKDGLVQIYEEVDVIAGKNDFIKTYLEKYKSFCETELSSQLLETQTDLKNLELEKQTLINVNNKRIKDINAQKPKYYSVKFDKFAEKAHSIIEQNIKRIQEIEDEIKRLELSTNIIELKQEITFLNPTSFVNFIDEISGLQNLELEIASPTTQETVKEKPKKFTFFKKIKSEVDKTTETEKKDDENNKPEEKEFKKSSDGTDKVDNEKKDTKNLKKEDEEKKEFKKESETGVNKPSIAPPNDKMDELLKKENKSTDLKPNDTSKNVFLPKRPFNEENKNIEKPPVNNYPKLPPKPPVQQKKPNN